MATATAHQNSWQQTKWGSLATLEYGKSLRDYDDERSETKPVQVFGTNGPIGWHSSPLCETAGIVVGRKGAYRGIHFSTEPFFVIDTAFYLRPKTEFDIRWAYYQLKDFDINKLDSGSAIPSTSRDAFYEIPVSIPPLPVQRRIAGMLSAYDELMENCQRRIRLLEAMARALYREWFVHFRFPGHEKLPRVASPLGDIPQGWMLGKLADVCRVIPGYAFKSSDWQSTGVPVVKIKNIQQDNTIDIENTDFVSDAVFQATPSKFVLGHGDILIAMTGATAGKIGKLRVNDRFLLNQRVAKILPAPAFYSLVWCAISTEESQERFFRLADGAAQPNMSGSQIEAVELICPPRSIAEAFSRLAEPILTQTDTLYLKIQNLRRTRDLLLPRLLSGQVSLAEN